MGIFSRLSDIINANINSMLDSAENPEKMIRLVIQEMEETLVEVRTNSAKLIAEKKDLTRRNDRLWAQVNEWQDKAEMALGKGREDLAKAALLEKSNAFKNLDIGKEEVLKLDDTLARLAEEIEALQAKIDDAKARQKALTARTRATENRLSVNSKLNDGSIEKAINKLDYFEQKIDRMEGQIEADAIAKSSLDDEFEKLAMEDKIDEELQALKDRMASK